LFIANRSHKAQLYFYLKMVGFEPGSSVPVADAMTTAPRHYQGYQVSLIKKSPKM
jgi:hypothetical protein